MHPVAYGLRDHAIFKSPFEIDVTATTEVKTPRSWADKLAAKTVSVIHLTDDIVSTRKMPGWCVYEYNLKQSPEIEILCGGINDIEE